MSDVKIRLTRVLGDAAEFFVFSGSGVELKRLSIGEEFQVEVQQAPPRVFVSSKESAYEQ